MKQRQRMFAYLVYTGRYVGQLRHDRFRYSMRALLAILLLALHWPVLLMTIGLHLQLAHGGDAVHVDTTLYQAVDWSGQFVPAIGASMVFIAWYLFYFLAFRVFCDRRGRIQPKGLVVSYTGRPRVAIATPAGKPYICAG